MTQITHKTVLTSCIYILLGCRGIHAGVSDSQMQYAGSKSDSDSIPSDSTEDLTPWPTQRVPGMNLDEIISYENGHNFNLRPSRSVALANRQPKETLVTVTGTANTNTNSSSVANIPPDTTPPPDLSEAPNSLDHAVDKRKASTRPDPLYKHPDPNGPDGMPNYVAWFDRGCNFGNLPNWTWKRSSDDNSTNSRPPNGGGGAGDGAQDIIDRYLPYFRLNNKINKKLLQDRAAETRSDKLPYGAVRASGSITVYTDLDAFKQMVYTVHNGATDTQCGGGTPPVFSATTKAGAAAAKPSDKGSKTGDKKDAKNKNANGNARFGLAGADAKVGKRREGEDPGDWASEWYDYGDEADEDDEVEEHGYEDETKPASADAADVTATATAANAAAAAAVTEAVQQQQQQQQQQEEEKKNSRRGQEEIMQLYGPDGKPLPYDPDLFAAFLTATGTIWVN